MIGCAVLQGCHPPAPSPDTAFEAIRTEARRGDFSLANKDAARAFANWQSRPQAAWHWKFRLLYAELLLLNSDTRAASALLGDAPPASAAALLPRYTMLRGYVAYREGKAPDAEAMLQNAAAAAHARADFELEADCELLRANYGSAGEAAETEKRLSRILQLGKDHGLNYQAAAAWLDYGMLRIRQSRFAEAIPYFEQSLQTASQAGATLLYSIAAGDLATCYYNLGDFDRAQGMRLKAIEAQKKAGLKTPLRDSYLELGLSQSLQGNSKDAIVSLREALSLVNAADSPARYSMIAGYLASALEASGALDEAGQFNRKALAVSTAADPEVAAALEMNEAAIAEDRGMHDAAIEGYRKALRLSAGSPSLMWSGYAALGSVYAALGQSSEARANFEAAIRTIDANRAEQLQSKYKITFLSRLIRLYQEYVDLLVREGDSARALEVADSSRAAVLTQDLRDLQRRSQPVLAPALRRMAGRTHSVFLFYWLAPRRSWLWVISEAGVNIVPLPDGHQLADQVRSYRYLIEREKIDPLTASAKLPAELFTTLVAPALRWIPKGSQVVIIPDDALHSLNFEALVSREPRPHYWLEDVTVSIAPSLSVLAAEAVTTKRTQSLLLIGDPDTGGTGFSKLPDAGAEIEKIRSHFPATAVTVQRAAQATAAAYENAGPRRYAAIHFAAHAEANEQSPLESAIILTPQSNGFRLYARDIMEIPLTADLVTISACRSAGARTLSGEGPVGFEWAFFHAGARNVVAGLWDVNDRSTSELMDRFYAKLQAGHAYAAALREAKLDMLETPFHKPYYWAPFQLYTRILTVR